MQLLAKAFLWLHVTLYRLTNGRIGGRFVAGSPILLLTTTGRRTGKRRTRPLAYVRDDDRYVLCASNGGSPTHPGWYHNLQATGRAEIQVGPNHLTVRGQDGRPGRAPPVVPPLCPDVQGLWRLRGQDQPPDPAGPADPGATEPNRLNP
jgi:deazaflavin-dependent oxidoreductase (nitroreductase family)